jgi:hypothetical protein
MTCEVRRVIETKTGINVTYIIKLILAQTQLCYGSHAYESYIVCDIYYYYYYYLYLFV